MRLQLPDAPVTFLPPSALAGEKLSKKLLKLVKKCTIRPVPTRCEIRAGSVSADLQRCVQRCGSELTPWCTRSRQGEESKAWGQGGGKGDSEETGRVRAGAIFLCP